MKPIRTERDATKALFDAQAIVSIIKEVYLEDEGKELDQSMVGRALDVSFDLIDEKLPVSSIAGSHGGELMSAIISSEDEGMNTSSIEGNDFGRCLTNFGLRAFLFDVPAHENENLDGHIQTLQECAQAMQHVISIAWSMPNAFFAEDLKAAQLVPYSSAGSPSNSATFCAHQRAVTDER